ncbi:MAG TPA: tetratricopeptide repeat protein [Candidatus Angelobacter sp.]|nr:tetratricopeptide repeat protein [Candidatus Angelobacter sp.]
MKPILLFSFFFFPLISTLAPSAFAQKPAPRSSSAEPQSTVNASAREEQLYQAGTGALDHGNYDVAVQKFDQVSAMHGRRADAALYWKAYALSKAGNKAEAEATIAELRKSYPQSKWLRDAGALEVEMKGAAVNPQNISDEELKLLALQSLMNAEPDKAVPMLDKIIRGNYSPRLKDKALFVLSQNSSSQAQQILLSLAKANNDPELQKRAIRYLGMGGSRNNAVLKQIYDGTTNVSVKKAVFQGWLMSGDKQDVLAVARTETSPELRREAIRYVGMMGGREELRAIYNSARDASTRREVVRAMLLCGDAPDLEEIVNIEKDPEVLEQAINTLGMVGGEGSMAALTKIYNSHSDLATKRRVINAMFLHGSAKEMVAMARKETNPELKRDWIQKLSLMNSPEVTEYMQEILNK